MSKAQPVWSWRHALELADLPSLSKLLGYTIANDLSDSGKFSQRSAKELAAACGMSLKSVDRHSANLEAAGFLHVEVRRNDLGHPIGRKWSPRFPENCELPREPAVSQTDFVADSQKDSQSSQKDSQTVPPVTESFIYKDTSPSTFRKTLKDSAEASPSACGVRAAPEQGERQGSGDPEGRQTKGRAKRGEAGRTHGGQSFEDFLQDYPPAGRKGLATAGRKWKGMSQSEQQKRRAALAGYLKHLADPEFAWKRPQQVSTFLNSGWVDYQVDETVAAAVDETQKVQALALDLQDDAGLNRARQWWTTFQQVPQAIRDAAEKLCRSWQPQAEGAFA